MTAGVQCETCRKFSPSPGGAWLYLVRPSAEPSIMTTLGLGQRDEPLTFCAVRCLAEWAIVQAATTEPATGKEPG